MHFVARAGEQGTFLSLVLRRSLRDLSRNSKPQEETRVKKLWELVVYERGAILGLEQRKPYHNQPVRVRRKKHCHFGVGGTFNLLNRIGRAPDR